MRKTIFKGTVNGETFDNVAAYNARLQELINSGEVVNASSNTRIEDVENTSDINATNKSNYVTSVTNYDCTYEDEDLSFFPYHEECDPYYLDLLVTNDEDVNIEALKEARNVLDKCYNFITEYLDDLNTSFEEKKDYLKEIQTIIKDIKRDNKCNVDTLTSLKKRRVDAENELKRAEEQYSNTIESINNSEKYIRDAKPVIDEFLDFYQAIESEILTSISNDKNCTCKTCGKPMNKCTCDKDVETTVTEKEPQTEWDLNKIIDVIFGDGAIRKGLV